MALTIGSNIASLMAQRKLSESSQSLSKTHEKLSSGMRINRASDDAAGLAIADTLNSKTKVYTRGIQNLNDGISLLSVAESAIGSLTDITTRLTELAEQAANGTYSNKQRDAMDQEAQTLAKEYFRIARSTTFNGVNLFDGSVQGLALQAGFGTDGMIQSSLGGNLGTGSFGTATNSGTGVETLSVALGDLNGDGVLDVVSARDLSSTASVLLGNGDGTFKAKSDFGTGSDPRSVALGDLNGDGILDIVTANASGSASALLGNGDGTFKAKSDFGTGNTPYSIALGDLNGDGVLDIVTANANPSGSASVLLGNGDGTFKAKSDFGTGAFPYSIALGDLNGDGVLDIVSANPGSNTASVLLGNGDGTFKAKSDLVTGSGPFSVALGDLNGDGVLDIVSANQANFTASVFLGNGDGTFQAKPAVTTGGESISVALGDLNGDGILDIVSGNGDTASTSVLIGNGDGAFKSNLDLAGGGSGTALGDLNGDGVLDIVSANTNGTNTSVFLAKTRDGISPILPFSLKTLADARQAMGPLKRTLENLGTQRGVLGAFESRLSYATATLGATVENYKSAESRIRDADIAEESANLVRQQILQQVGAAILAQANQAPQIALALLRG